MTPAERDTVVHEMMIETREDLAKADAKATLVLAGLGIGLGAVLGGALAGDWEPSKLHGFWQVVWWCGAAVLTAAIWSCASAVWPRYDDARTGDAIHYWADVAVHDTRESFERVLDKQLPPLHERRLVQLYELSKVVRRKYELVRRAMWVAALGTALCLVAALAG